MTRTPTVCFLSLGTNLGDKHANMLRAIELLAERVGDVLRVSAFHETEPWGFSSGNQFLNACVKVQTTLSPYALLRATQKIEREMGRTQKSHNGEYHDRIIDIDILLYGDERIDEADLKIPHPLMYEREFVMNPLKEIMI